MLMSEDQPERLRVMMPIQLGYLPFERTERINSVPDALMSSTFSGGDFGPKIWKAISTT